MSIKYPFGTRLIREAYLLEWLTKFLYPQEYRSKGSHKSYAKNRIRNRVYRARKETGALKIKSEQTREGTVRYFDSREFFGWACEQRGWESLKTLEGLPRNTTINLEPLPPIRAELNKTSVMLIPQDYEELKTAFIALHNAHENKSLEEARIRRRNQDLESIVSKFEMFREKAREYAKRPKQK